jgi:putative ABC transport system permease protein
MQLAGAIKGLSAGGNGGGRGAGRLRSILVCAEVALSAVCLVVSGLLLHSLVNLLTVDKGFETDRVTTVDLNLSGQRYQTLEARSAFRRALSEQLQTLPGVMSVAVSNKLPLTGTGQNSALSFEGTTTPLLERPLADVRTVSPEYFDTWGIPLTAGRRFDTVDGLRPVVMLSAYTVAQLWPDSDPVGRRLRLGGNPNGALLEVVGVVGDVRGISLDRAPAFTAYVPHWQRDSQITAFAVKTSIDSPTLASAIRAAIRDLDPNMPSPSVRTMDEVIAESMAERRFQMRLVMIFAAGAMLLAGLGIYGVLSYAVAQRTSEIGIRLALGAGPGHVRHLVLHDAVVLVGAGLSAGVPLAVGIGYWLRTLLFGVIPQDPVTVVGVCLTILGVALLAAFLPAHRASRIDPMLALRCD